MVSIKPDLMKMQHGFEAINDKYILYNMRVTKEDEEGSVSYIMDRSGKNARKINGERIYTPVIHGNYIYYLTEERYLHRITIDGQKDEMLSDAKIYNLNVSDNGIFYFREIYSETGEVESVAIYRLDAETKKSKKIYTLEESSTSLCLTDDWVFFLDSNEEEGRMEIISPDGKQKIDLFTLYYADYYYLDELIEERKQQTEEESESETEEPTDGSE